MNFKPQISNFKWFWWWLRQVLGDAAYENYLRSAARSGGAGPHAGPNGAAAGARPYATALSREQFFLDSLRRRYSSFSRCC